MFIHLDDFQVLCGEMRVALLQHVEVALWSLAMGFISKLGIYKS